MSEPGSVSGASPSAARSAFSVANAGPGVPARSCDFCLNRDVLRCPDASTTSDCRSGILELKIERRCPVEPALASGNDLEARICRGQIVSPFPPSRSGTLNANVFAV